MIFEIPAEGDPRSDSTSIPSQLIDRMISAANFFEVALGTLRLAFTSIVLNDDVALAAFTAALP
jgi:hypothetical protein